MPISNLSLITGALGRLVQESVATSSEWTGSSAPEVSYFPPDQLQDDADLGMYLYHIIEVDYSKNQPPVGRSTDPFPVRSTPMGLALYYVITTGLVIENNNDVFDAQLLLGLTVKALHDNAKIDETTEINGVNIFNENDLVGTDTILQVEMLPLDHNEAVNYWTAGQTPLRLAAYYKVSVIMLEPEDPPSYAGQVYDFGIQTFLGGSARLDSSRNKLSVTNPATGTTQSLTIQPAQVALDAQVEFLGSNLKGDETQLLIEHENWAEPLVADMNWGVAVVGDTRVVARVQNRVIGQSLFPGFYSAKVIVVRQRRMPDGLLQDFPQESNSTPFTVVSRVDSVSAPDVNAVVTVAGEMFESGDPDPDVTKIWLGNVMLNLIVDTLNIQAAEYEMIDINNLRLRLPTAIEAGYHPLRIIINGAESTPAWVEVR